MRKRHTHKCKYIIWVVMDWSRHFGCWQVDRLNFISVNLPNGWKIGQCSSIMIISGHPDTFRDLAISANSKIINENLKISSKLLENSWLREFDSKSLRRTCGKSSFYSLISTKRHSLYKFWILSWNKAYSK